METLEKTLRHSHDWAIDRITFLCDKEDCEQLENAFAIEREFDEWLNDLENEHNIFSLAYIGEGSEYE
tara:strand:+ start:3037 stop:3240 length:204 start_codon:yes stop_codon:yes gene_type:complete